MVKTLQIMNSLNAADVIVAKKRSGIGRILNHYLVYLGNNTFIGNLKDGVKILTNSELKELLVDYEPVRLKPFIGTENERRLAIKRAYNNLGKKYSLTNFNCEHFANLVQKGVKSSSQVTVGILISLGLTYKIIKSVYGKRA